MSHMFKHLLVESQAARLPFSYNLTIRYQKEFWGDNVDGWKSEASSDPDYRFERMINKDGKRTFFVYQCHPWPVHVPENCIQTSKLQHRHRGVELVIECPEKSAWDEYFD